MNHTFGQEQQSTYIKWRTLSSSSASSSLRSSISCTKSRRKERRPGWRPGTVRGVGYGCCCRRGMRVGNNGGRGRTVGVATDMMTAVNSTLNQCRAGARFSSHGRWADDSAALRNPTDSGRITANQPPPTNTRWVPRRIKSKRSSHHHRHHQIQIIAQSTTISWTIYSPSSTRETSTSLSRSLRLRLRRRRRRRWTR